MFPLTSEQGVYLSRGQRLAEQIEREDPEQVARLREQFGGMRQNNNNPDSSGSGGGGSGSQ